MFFGCIFEFFPDDLKIVLEALMQLFEVLGQNLH